MTEALAGVSTSNTEYLLEQPSLADAAVAGVRGSGELDDPADVMDLAEPPAEEPAIARELVRSASARGVAMTGQDGMLNALTRAVIETVMSKR
jgi:hypothetical protein